MSQKKAEAKTDEGGSGAQASLVWQLEDTFPVPMRLLKPVGKLNASTDGVLVVLDTNVLLLPLSVSLREISEIEGILQKLVTAGRLAVPARAIREYISNRDRKLADLEQSIRDKSSRASFSPIDIPSLLEGIEGAAEFKKAEAALSEAKKNYLKRVADLTSVIQSWRGDDPVTSMYAKLFDDGVIVDITDSREDLLAEWSLRSDRKIPPGYKDAAKEDTGIGDFLLWKSILQIGKVRSMDLIFVTGDEKADWSVRSNGRGIYPRPELVDEYRGASGGRNFYMCSFADMLSDMKASAEAVSEVREAQEQAAMYIVTEAKDKKNLKFDSSIIRKQLDAYLKESRRISNKRYGLIMNEPLPVDVGRDKTILVLMTLTGEDSVLIEPTEDIVRLSPAPITDKGDEYESFDALTLQSGTSFRVEDVDGVSATVKIQSINKTSVEKIYTVTATIVSPYGYDVFA